MADDNRQYVCVDALMRSSDTFPLTCVQLQCVSDHAQQGWIFNEQLQQGWIFNNTIIVRIHIYVYIGTIASRNEHQSKYIYFYDMCGNRCHYWRVGHFS